MLIRNNRKIWNYHPNLPIQTAPYFNWPPQPLVTFKWLLNLWLPITERGLITILSIFTWIYYSPSLNRCHNFSLDWIAEIYLRNFSLMFLIAGILHLYFYSFSMQGKVLKFDDRELATNSRRFTLKNQVWDNMFWSLGSGVLVWSSYEVLLMWGFANGYGLLIHWGNNPVWFVSLFLLLPLWQAFSFYWIHRFLHWPPLYKLAHSVHHRNANIGPWSGNSMHPVEHILWLSSVSIHWLIASHPVHVIYYLQLQVVGAVTSHSGFEELLISDKKRYALGEFFHQLHHRYYECNYGSSETHWDRLFGTFHDGSENSLEKIKKSKYKI